MKNRDQSFQFTFHLIHVNHLSYALKYIDSTLGTKSDVTNPAQSIDIYSRNEICSWKVFNSLVFHSNFLWKVTASSVANMAHRIWIEVEARSSDSCFSENIIGGTSWFLTYFVFCISISILYCSSESKDSKHQENIDRKISLQHMMK